MKLKNILAVASLAPVLSFAAAASASAEDREYVFILHGNSGVPFFQKIIAGAEEAAERIGFEVTFAFGDGDPVLQNSHIENAVARGVDGIVLAINVDDAYEENISNAISAGIPVIASNVDSSTGAEGSDRLAFVGQDFVAAGYALGKRVISETGIGEGDKLACPVEFPEANYAITRHAGVQAAFDEVGATCELFGVGVQSMDSVLTKINQYLLGHPDVKGVIGLGSMPTEMAPQAITDSGIEAFAAGFDISEPIIISIINGDMIATVDQQPFYQGFMAVTQLYYMSEYGLQPADFNTGSALIDASNAELTLELASTVR